ncbi:iron-containing alcohol dehydrogenase [Thiomicrorhabdus aquaedulcis]|uniref:iron-containing alcohol dehydrogenase n=1 Tax=Thiomicrorhabdus aquaedulcis TaxID=2211106 RepID=UPI000FDB98B4|nr:iron-containing alcohol dehydrogenase [Thiomicrorhabdus aquaedulcis]
MHSQHNSSAIAPFVFASMPQVRFGWGVRHNLAQHVVHLYGQKVVLICSGFLAQPGQFGHTLTDDLQNLGGQVTLLSLSGEPSPETVDTIVKQCSPHADLVIGLGGGSVLDAAKAVAGLIPSQTSVMDYLEGVGAGKAFEVNTCPFIALPTTAGTGSETTKNAVLSRLGAFKKSFRDDKLLAKEAWLDPELLITCPKDILYATGMDAFTQLLESYTTLKANPITDALAWQGMMLFKGAFEAIDSEHAEQQQQGYGRLMLAASLSGTTLANGGLGAVHGLAGPIGAFFDAPHGLVCARLLSPITALNLQSLQQSTDPQHKTILAKYQQIEQLFDSPGLVNTLNEYAQRYTPQGLAHYGLRADNLAPVLAACRSGSMLGNPITLSDAQLTQALLSAL